MRSSVFLPGGESASQADEQRYTVSKKPTGGKFWALKFTTVGNLASMTKWGGVAGLVLDDSEMNYFMTYSNEND